MAPLFLSVKKMDHFQCRAFVGYIHSLLRNTALPASPATLSPA